MSPYDDGDCGSNDDDDNHFFFLRWSFALVAQAGVQWAISAHYNLRLLGSRDSLASASRAAGTIGVHHYAWLIFVFLVDMMFHYVGQAGLELLTSSDLPTSASQSVGIAGVSCRTQPGKSYFKQLPFGKMVGRENWTFSSPAQFKS